MTKKSNNIELVFEILRNEVNGNVKSAQKKMHDDFTVTYMYKNKKSELFPSFSKPSDFDLSEIYKIKDKSYEIKNYAENNFDKYDVVFVELIERYTDPKTGKKYQTPIVIVLEIEDGKIKTNRHYCGNDLSFEDISAETINSAFKGESQEIFVD